MPNEPKNLNDPEKDLEKVPEPMMGTDPEEPEILEVHPQDSFHRIIFGQVEEPLFPAPPSPSDTPEDDLTNAAMNDPAGRIVDLPDTKPTLWRFLALIVMVVVALTIVFWKR